MAKIRDGNGGRGDTHEGLSGEHYGERCLESAGERGECEDKRGIRLCRRETETEYDRPLPINPSVVAQFLRGIFSVIDSLLLIIIIHSCQTHSSAAAAAVIHHSSSFIQSSCNNISTSIIYFIINHSLSHQQSLIVSHVIIMPSSSHQTIIHE